MASVIRGTTMSSAYEAGRQSTSNVETDSFSKGSGLNNSRGIQALPKPPSNLVNSEQMLNNSANWHSYSMNSGISIAPRQTHTVLTPPSSWSSTSPISSFTSSPVDANAQTSCPAASSYFDSFRPRSNSLAIPAPTIACPNCGLRRPSSVSDQVNLSSSQPTSVSATRPHLPLHLHCPDSCPDEVHPAKGPTSPITPPHKRYHHRRRSSLCYTESLVENADIIDSGGVPADVKTGWEKQAEMIARKVVSRRLGSDDTMIPEEAIVEE